MKAPRTIAAALLAALTLAACAPASGTQTSAPAAAPDTGQAADPAAAAGAGLRILTAGNADGMYAAVTVPEPGSRIFPTLLSWIDYASARQVILCSRPNCDHSDDSCPARLPAGAGEAGCYALDDGLLLKYSVTDPDTYALTGQYLYLCAADGSDPRLLAQTAANWDLLTDGDAVYYSCQQAESQDPDALAQSVWYRQPLSGGQAEELFRCDIADMPVCCAGRELVQVSWFDNALYAVNMDTGVRRTLPMTPAGEDGQSSAFAALDGRLYQLLPGDTDTLRWLDIASGQAGTLALQWPDGAAAGEPGPFSAAGGKLLLELGDGAGNYRRVAVDPADGSVTEVPLQFMDGSYLQPVRILAEGGSQLYVQYETRFESVTLPGKSGEPVPGETAVPRTALISYTDFFAGVPNYRDVETLPAVQ